jgi:hypothetical protein
MAETTIEEQNELAEKTYRSIGQFMYEFSQTEYTIRHHLAQQLKPDDIFFAAVVQSYDVGLLCNVTKQVVKASMTVERATVIESLINQFMKLNEDRIRVAHGLWMPHHSGGVVQHVSRNSLEPKMMPQSFA